MSNSNNSRRPVGASVASYYSAEEQLHAAIEQLNINKAIECLENGANLSSTCEHGLTAIGAAVRRGHQPMLSMLLQWLLHNPTPAEEKPAETAATTPDGMEALQWDQEFPDEEVAAAEEEDDDCSRLYHWYADILSRTAGVCRWLRADVDAVDAFEASPLHYAAQSGQPALARLLLEAGARVNLGDGNTQSALHLASKHGHRPMVGFLLAHGADVNQVTSRKETPLHMAALNGCVATITALIEHGAHVNALDRHDRTPLFYAVSRSNEAALEVLLQRGAKPNIEDASGRVPLHEAVAAKSIRAAYLLTKSGAKAIPSYYLLHDAIKMGYQDFVRLLVQAGCGVNGRDEQGNTPLLLAVERGHSSIVQFLLQKGAFVNAPNSITGVSAFVAAAAVDDASFTVIFDLLVNSGAYLSLNSRPDSPLWRAISDGKFHNAKYMIRFGLFNAKTGSDMSAAIKTKDISLVQLMLCAGYALPWAYLEGQQKELLPPYGRVLPLLHLARISIRKSLGWNVPQKVQRLGLPSQMVDFLLFHDLVPGWV